MHLVGAVGEPITVRCGTSPENLGDAKRQRLALGFELLPVLEREAELPVEQDRPEALQIGLVVESVAGS